MNRIYGIPCSIKSPALQRTIRSVLRQIRHRCPKDFERIRRKVRKFALLESSDKTKGSRTMAGAWDRRQVREELEDPYNFELPGVVRLDGDIPEPVAILAHELGHACTREEDFERRTDHGEEWTSEMCADSYGYKWGFGRHIARKRKDRSFSHHGPGPGSTLWVDSPDGTISRYRVTRHFYIHFVQKETKDGQIIETAAQREARLIREFKERLESPRRAE